MSDYKVGDRVRVAFEGTVQWLNESIAPGENPNMDVRFDNGDVIPLYREALAAGYVEKIEPPVEVFGRGDTVKSKRSGFRFLILRDGYVDLLNNVYVAGPQAFTSKSYEKVE